jgi:hypothetical protein
MIPGIVVEMFGGAQRMLLAGEHQGIPSSSRLGPFKSRRIKHCQKFRTGERLYHQRSTPSALRFLISARFCSFNSRWVSWGPRACSALVTPPSAMSAWKRCWSTPSGRLFSGASSVHSQSGYASNGCFGGPVPPLTILSALHDSDS